MSKPRKQFRSADEMGRAFDEHEVTEENSTPTTVAVEKRYDPTLTMRLPDADLRKLKALADTRGLPTATMGRMLLLERLHEGETSHAAGVRLLEALVDDAGLRAALRELLQERSPKALDRARKLVEKSRAA